LDYAGIVDRANNLKGSGLACSARMVLRREAIRTALNESIYRRAGASVICSSNNVLIEAAGGRGKCYRYKKKPKNN